MRISKKKIVLFAVILFLLIGLDNKGHVFSY